MKLTQAQKVTVNTWITANASGQGDQAVADLLNAIASPDYFVWRTLVTLPEVQADPGFDWTRVDNLSVGKARIWEGMFNATDTMPPALGNYRTGIDAVWVGTQADLDVRAAVKGVCRRKVSVLEKMFTTQTVGGPAQTGSRGATTNPDTLGVDADNLPLQGLISAQNVSDIRSGL